MKRKKTHQEPLTDLQRLARRVAEYRLPHGPFDYMERAKAATDAEQFFHEIVRIAKSHHADPEAKAVIEAARKVYLDAWDMAYPPGFWEDYAQIRAGDASGMESAVSFLEADPWFFRSGYVKQKLIRAIKPSLLTPDYAARLQNVVLSVVEKRYDRDMRNYRNLAWKVNSPELREQLKRRIAEGNFDVRSRARWVLMTLEPAQIMDNKVMD